MHDETSGSVTVPDPKVGRYRHLFRAVLLTIGLCYVLALPIIANLVILEINNLGGHELCLDSRDPGLGIEIEDEPPGGKIRCKLLLRRILLFWSVIGLIFMPIAAPMAALRYVMRRAVDLEGPGSELQRRDKLVRIVSIVILSVYAVGGVLKDYADWYW